MFLSKCYGDMIVAFTETESMWFSLNRRLLNSNWVVYKTSTGYTTIVSKTINKFRKKKKGKSEWKKYIKRTQETEILFWCCYQAK